VVNLQSKRPPTPAHVTALLQQYLQWRHPTCEDTHGVLIGVPPDVVPRVEAALDTAYGHGTKKWRRQSGQVYDIEFIAAGPEMRPRKPWDYCGASILFNDEQAKEQQAMVEAARFKEGDAVVFRHLRKQKHGYVARINPSRVTVVVPHEGTFYVPGKDLAIDE
jgi:hypothetical protein